MSIPDNSCDFGGKSSSAPVESPECSRSNALSETFPRALRDDTQDCLDAAELFLEAAATLTRDVECNHSTAAYHPGEVVDEGAAKYIARAKRKPGAPRGVPYQPSVTGSLAIDAGKRLIAVVQNLADPREQAEVLRCLSNAAAGGLMQHHMDALARCQVEQELCNDDAREGYAVIDPEVVAADVIAVEQRMSVHTAMRRFQESRDIYHRLPRLWNLISEGRLSPWVAGIIATETAFVTDAAALAEVEDGIIALMAAGKGTAEWSGYLTRRLREMIFRLDPEGARKQEDAARRTRRIDVRAGHDGHTDLDVTLEALDAELIMAAVNEVAERWARNPNETRVKSARQADALVQLVTGVDKRPPPDGRPDPLEAAPLRPKITLVADIGPSETHQRVWVGGGATIRARLDELLERSDTATVDLVPAAASDSDADLSEALDLLARLQRRVCEETTYSPSADLRRRVVERDGTCRHPGCAVSAARCDLDHVLPFNPFSPAHGGLTREGNLVALCRKHHRLKTHGNARYQLHPDGSVTAEIGDSCVGHSYPEGHRGDLRAVAGYRYNELPADYAERLERVAEESAELARVIREVLAGDRAQRNGDQPASVTPIERAARRRERTVRNARSANLTWIQGATAPEFPEVHDEPPF